MKKLLLLIFVFFVFGAKTFALDVETEAQVKNVISLESIALCHVSDVQCYKGPPTDPLPSHCSSPIANLLQSGNIGSSPLVQKVLIVYPKKTPVVINSSSTFFIGSANPNQCLKINDFEVKVSPSGAFAQAVPLDFGVNNFKIVSDKDVIDFVIERPQPAATDQQKPQEVLIEYPAVINFSVSKDNAPLRMTPVDSGINRMSHLPKDVKLLINGEKGNFYRVYLNSTLTGWIAKSDVGQSKIGKKENSGKTFNNFKLNDFKTKEEKDFWLYELSLYEKKPFVIKEEVDGGLTLQVFNIEGKDVNIQDNTYSFNVPVKKLIGYDIYYDKSKLVLKVRRYPQIDPKKPLKGLTIAVDAGHGGKEFGAIGCCGDKEKDINLAIAKGVNDELVSRGAKVVMTRTEDVDVSLQDRVKIAKEKEAVLSVSIHANALPDSADPVKNRGTSVYYYYNQAKPLADSILDSMTAQLCTQNDKVRQGSLALVRSTSSVSVLIEVAYIINPDDYALLTDKDFQAKCAKAIADGIEKYISQQ